MAREAFFESPNTARRSWPWQTTFRDGLHCMQRCHPPSHPGAWPFTPPPGPQAKYQANMQAASDEKFPTLGNLPFLCAQTPQKIQLPARTKVCDICSATYGSHLLARKTPWANKEHKHTCTHLIHHNTYDITAVICLSSDGIKNIIYRNRMK